MFLMTDLTEKQQAILEALRSAGDWVDRAGLAAALEKPRLNPHDVEMLGRLIEANLVEVDERETGITQKYVYRAAGAK